jgi:hypothetical protein
VGPQTTSPAMTTPKTTLTSGFEVIPQVEPEQTAA